MAHPTETVKRPGDWDKAIAAAYLRLIGWTQKESAEGAGVGERTLKRWEKSDWWPEASEEASGRWLKHLVEDSRISVLSGVKKDPALALKIIERTDPRLAPPALQVGGNDGGPIEFTLVIGEGDE